MRYPFLKYTDDMPEGVGGYAKYFFVRIRPKYKDDKGIHEHEYAHVMQWALFFVVGICAAMFAYAAYGNPMLSASILVLGFFAHNALYGIAPWYKLHCEVEAYRMQALNYPDDRRKLFGEFIATSYNLDITPAEAEYLLRN